MILFLHHTVHCVLTVSVWHNNDDEYNDGVSPPLPAVKMVTEEHMDACLADLFPTKIQDAQDGNSLDKTLIEQVDTDNQIPALASFSKSRGKGGTGLLGSLVMVHGSRGHSSTQSLLLPRRAQEFPILRLPQGQKGMLLLRGCLVAAKNG